MKRVSQKIDAPVVALYQKGELRKVCHLINVAFIFFFFLNEEWRLRKDSTSHLTFVRMIDLTVWL